MKFITILVWLFETGVVALTLSSQTHSIIVFILFAFLEGVILAFALPLILFYEEELSKKEFR